MRLAQLSSTRAASGQDPQPDTAKLSFVFALNCLRIGRLAGDIKKDDAYTVSNVTGQQLNACSRPPAFQEAGRRRVRFSRGLVGQ